MFKAGSELTGKTPKEILYLDFKKFTAGGKTFGVGQVTSMEADELADLKNTMVEYINESFAEHEVDMLFFLLTDILDESSELIYAKAQRKLLMQHLLLPKLTALTLRALFQERSRSFLR